MALAAGLAALGLLGSPAVGRTAAQRTPEQIQATFDAHKNEFDYLDFGTGRKEGAEMRIEQTFGVAAGTPSVWRIRYYNIRPDAFSWTADRSNDAGKTWITGFQQIEARRIAPPRTMGPLAPARRPAAAPVPPPRP